MSRVIFVWLGFIFNFLKVLMTWFCTIIATTIYKISTTLLFRNSSTASTTSCAGSIASSIVVAISVRNDADSFCFDTMNHSSVVASIFLHRDLSVAERLGFGGGVAWKTSASMASLYSSMWAMMEDLCFGIEVSRSPSISISTVRWDQSLVIWSPSSTWMQEKEKKCVCDRENVLHHLLSLSLCVRKSPRPIYLTSITIVPPKRQHRLLEPPQTIGTPPNQPHRHRNPITTITNLDAPPPIESTTNL